MDYIGYDYGNDPLYYEEMLDFWLQSSLLTRESFVEKFAGSQTLYLVPAVGEETIRVYFSNGVTSELMEDLPIYVVKELPDIFIQNMVVVYEVAILAGDLLFGKTDNPIRSLEAGENRDGGLSDVLRRMLDEENGIST